MLIFLIFFQKLKSYGLFKQIAVGNVNTDRPGFFSPVDRAKWDAWKECENMDKEVAYRNYIDLVNEVNPDWKNA